jgi:hypothetical protein
VGFNAPQPTARGASLSPRWSPSLTIASGNDLHAHDMHLRRTPQDASRTGTQEKSALASSAADMAEPSKRRVDVAHAWLSRGALDGALRAIMLTHRAAGQ